MFVVNFDSADLAYPTLGGGYFPGCDKASVCLSSDEDVEGFKEFLFPTEDEARDFVLSMERIGWMNLWVSAHNVSAEELMAEV